MKMTSRSKVRRIPERGKCDRKAVYEILDEGFLAHVGFTVNGQPFVIPTLYGRDRDSVILHGSAASRMLRELKGGIPACIGVTLVDGIVLARSAFNHSMNYRSVVAFGTAQSIAEPAEKIAALHLLSEHLIAGRWSDVRRPTDKELKATLVLRFTIEEASSKIRTGPPIDDEEDYDLNVWAGVLPLRTSPQPAVEDPNSRRTRNVPAYVRNYADRLRVASDNNQY